MATPQDASEVVPYLSSAVTIYFVQKQFKNTATYQQFVAAFPGADKWAHWFVAGVMSLGASIGIHVVWTCALCSSYDPTKGGTALVTIPSITDMIHGLADFWKVFVLQQGMHEMANPKDQIVRREQVLAPVTTKPTEVQP